MTFILNFNQINLLRRILKDLIIGQVVISFDAE